MSSKYDGLALFSGGLDSILACRVLAEQGRRVLAVHYVSPFFGFPGMVDEWKRLYDIEVFPVDVGDEYVDMLLAGPAHGLGKCLNPCVDCKIFMLKKTREMLADFDAKFIVSGEVVGQRPMSQRRDALNLISKQAGVRDLLVRPLCARAIEPTPVEEAGLVDRERLLHITGRGRKEQLRLAREYGFEVIPTPAGGCKLTEAESSKRYLPLLAHRNVLTRRDFDLANLGRQYWSGPHWLAIGRNQEDNEKLEGLIAPGDIVFDVADYPSPLAVARQFPDAPWPEEAVRDAASFMASFSPKAVAAGDEVDVHVRQDGQTRTISVFPSRETAAGWSEPVFDEQLESKQVLLSA